MEEDFRVGSFSLTYRELLSFIDEIRGNKKVYYGRFIYRQRNGVERRIGLGELSIGTLPLYLTDFSLFLYTAPGKRTRKGDFDFWIDSDGDVTIKGDRQVVADKQKTCREFLDNHRNNNRFIHTSAFFLFKYFFSLFIATMCSMSIYNSVSPYPVNWLPYFSGLSQLVIFISCSALLLAITLLLTYIYPYASVGARTHTTLKKIGSWSGVVIGILGTIVPLLIN